MKILFKYATRSRPELFKRGIDSIINNLSSLNYSIIVSLDGFNDDEKDNDTRLQDYVKILNKYNDRVNYRIGKSDNKIHAINRDVINYDFDILVNMSDDMVFTEKGFDDIIREEFVDRPDGGCTHIRMLDRCLHLPDGNRNDLITMAIIGRTYYNRFGYIYHPDYKSLYCDNEMTDVAKQLGCYKYVDKQIFEHRHPAYGKAVFDAQYQHTESFNQEDRDTYLKRRALNFGL